MDIVRIRRILRECAGELDKIDQPREGTELVDVWVQVPLKTELVQQHAPEMATLLNNWAPRVYNGETKTKSLGDELKITEVAAVLSGREWAFLLFAFGRLMQWWPIITPVEMFNLQKENPLADYFAGLGFISIVGFNAKVAA